MVAEWVGRPVRHTRTPPPSRSLPVGRAAMQSPGGNRGSEFDPDMEDEYDGYNGAARPQAGVPGQSTTMGTRQEPSTPQREASGGQALDSVGVGVGDNNDEMQALADSPTARDPSVRATSVANESPAPSSASVTSSRYVTRQDFQRVKRRLVRMSEHLRDSLMSTKTELWEAIDDEIQERKQEPPLFKKLLDDRTDAIAEAVRANLGGLRDDAKHHRAYGPTYRGLAKLGRIC